MINTLLIGALYHVRLQVQGKVRKIPPETPWIKMLCPRGNNNEKNSDLKHLKCILLLGSSAGADLNGSWSISEFGAAAFFWAPRLPESTLGSRLGSEGKGGCVSRETSGRWCDGPRMRRRINNRYCPVRGQFKIPRGCLGVLNLCRLQEEFGRFYSTVFHSYSIVLFDEFRFIMFWNCPGKFHNYQR